MLKVLAIHFTISKMGKLVWKFVHINLMIEKVKVKLIINLIKMALRIRFTEEFVLRFFSVYGKDPTRSLDERMKCQGESMSPIKETENDSSDLSQSS